MMRKTVLMLITISFLSTGCITPYKVDIEQGNIVEEKNLSRLQIGLSKKEVADILGEPVLNRVLNDSRWVYLYTKQTNGKKTKKDYLELKFKNDKLISISSVQP